MRLILDTSTLIAMLLARGKTYTRTIITLAQSNKVSLIISKNTFNEFKQKLSKVNTHDFPYYKPRIGAVFVAWYTYNSQLFSVHKPDVDIRLRDRKDAIFLQLAKVSKANYIITGDKDLLVLKTFEKTKIVTPEKFISREFPEFA